MLWKLPRAIGFLAQSVEQYLSFFDESQSCARGVFESFEHALSKAPKERKVGWDSASVARKLCERPKVLMPYDYPMLFWLSCLLRENPNLIDYGGSDGIHFRTYERYLQYPPEMNWLVCDLPEITRIGEEEALSEGRRNVSFTNNLQDASGKDIFVASGSIQFVDAFLDGYSRIERLPTHCLLNRVPLYSGRTFVTLRKSSMGMFPLFVYNEEEFTSHFLKLGYELVDKWTNLNDAILIPFRLGRRGKPHSQLK